MSTQEHIAALARRLNVVESATKPSHYPAPEEISYIADVDGLRAFFPTDDRYTHGWFYPRYSGGKLHEPAFVRYLLNSLKESSLFLDVGAHLGYFSVIAGMRAKLVFAIEPQEFLIGRIHRNVSANHLSNIFIIHAAAGEEPSFVGIPKVGSPTTKVNSATNLVASIRLDDYFCGEYLPSHIKIDTEGFEYQVLLGCSKIIERNPTLFIEVHQTMDNYGYTRSDLWTFLKNRGYRIGLIEHRSAAAEIREVHARDMENLHNTMLICEPV